MATVTPAALLSGLLAAAASFIGSVRGSARWPAAGSGPGGAARAAPAPAGRSPAGFRLAGLNRFAPRGAALLAALAALAVLGFPAGVPVALLAVALLPRAFARLEPAAARRARGRQLSELPLTADLVAAALAVGCPLREAVAVTAQVMAGPLAGPFEAALRELALGAAPETAWVAPFTGAPEPVLGFAAVLAEAEIRGVAPIPQLVAIAEQQRRAAATSAAEQAQRAGVRSVAPLGLCFLPAFVLVGVLPLVAAAAHLLRV